MAKTYKQIMDEARQIVPEVSPEQVKARLDKGERPIVLDVREKEEIRQGYVPGALPLPRGFLEMRVEEAVPDKNTSIVAYCGSGTRSLLAGRILKELGYTNVVSMRGGFTAWKNQGFPVKEDRQFTPEQQIRYSRHFLLPEVGEKGQAKLLDARCSASARAGSARRRRSTSPPRASARSASSIWTWSTSRTSSARSCTPTTASGCRRPSRHA